MHHVKFSGMCFPVQQDETGAWLSPGFLGTETVKDLPIFETISDCRVSAMVDKVKDGHYPIAMFKDNVDYDKFYDVILEKYPELLI